VTSAYRIDAGAVRDIPLPSRALIDAVAAAMMACINGRSAELGKNPNEVTIGLAANEDDCASADVSIHELARVAYGVVAVRGGARVARVKG